MINLRTEHLVNLDRANMAGKAFDLGIELPNDLWDYYLTIYRKYLIKLKKLYISVSHFFTG